jgi:HEAT repeat protein
VRNLLTRTSPVFICLVLTGGVLAQQPGSSASTAAELIEQEKLRQAVEQAFELYTQPVDSGTVEVENFVKAGDLLVEAGPGVIPHLISELEQTVPNTFFLCAYALGRLNTPEAEAALRQAVEKTETERGRYPEYRKAWALFSLSLMGKADAIDLINEGRHRAGSVPIHARWAALETIALHTYPQCLPHLISQLDVLAEDPEMLNQRILVLKALWHLPHPSAVPKLKELLNDSDPKIRGWAARALGAIATPEATAATLAALDDENNIVRRQAAWSLEHSQPQVDLSVILERLESEEDVGVRRSLYGLLAQRGGRSMLETLARHWGNQDSSDRASLMKAIGSIGGEEAVESLGRGLKDPDGRVVAFAAEALGKIGNERAIDLLIEGLRSPRWVVVQECTKQLHELREERAAPMIAKRLLKVELVSTLKEPSFRYHVEILCEALVALGHHQVLEELREAKERQVDSVLISFLDVAILKLETIKKNGRSTKKWIKTMGSSERALRILAYRRLGDIGGATAARAMAASFGRVEQDEGLEILKALRGIDADPSLALIERVLLAQEFDSVERADLRDAAAWAARRIGGDRMFEALKESAGRRHGRDAKVLVYLALLGGEKALPILTEHRLPRMVYVSWESGKELETIDWIIRQISNGRSIASLDTPPNELHFQ